MKNTRVFQFAGMLLSGVLCFAAQEGGWKMGGSLALPSGSAKDMMGLDTGLHLDAAYEFRISSGYGFRPGISLGYFNAKGVTGVKYNADTYIDGANGPLSNEQLVPGSSVTHKTTQLQVMADAIIPLNPKFNLVFGLSFNKYQVSFSGGRAATATDPGIYSPINIDAATYTYDSNGSTKRSGEANGNVSVLGVKIGLRLGLEYAFTEKISGRLLLQQTEMGRMTTIPSALQSVNPFWMDFGVVFRF